MTHGPCAARSLLPPSIHVIPRGPVVFVVFVASHTPYYMHSFCLQSSHSWRSRKLAHDKIRSWPHRRSPNYKVQVSQKRHTLWIYTYIGQCERCYTLWCAVRGARSIADEWLCIV